MIHDLIRRLCVVAVVLMCLGSAAAVAQPVDEAYLNEWDAMVTRVNRVMDADVANDATLERLREQVVGYRNRFLTAEDANQTALDRVQRQLDTLGPAPAEGEQEPAEVADRRAELNRQLADIRAPALRASEAFVEADSLVREIDAELRKRQTQQILKRFPLPVNPLNWEEPLTEINTAALEAPKEIVGKLASPDTRKEIVGNLPSAAVSLILGTLMVFRSRAWAAGVKRWINAVKAPIPRRILRLVNVIAQLALPWIGLTLLVGALQLTGIFGPTGSSVLLAVVAFGFAMIAGTWLVGQLFPRDNPEESPLLLLPRFMVKGRRMAYLMAATLSLYQGLSVLSQRLNLDTVTSAYLGFVLSLLTAYALFRLGRFFRRSVSSETPQLSDRAFAEAVIGVLAFAAMAVAVGSVVAGLAGYVILARSMIYPAAGTFFLFGFLAMAQRGFADFYAVLMNQATDAEKSLDAEQGLVPTLIGTLLALVSLPFLALLWGARVTDLTELWTVIQGGFTLGEVRISPSDFLTFLLVFVGGYLVTRLVQGGLRNTILPKTKLDIGARTAFVSGVGYLGIFLAALAAITTAGINLSSFAIFASALAVGIGFGLQTIVSNFVSGIILLIERPVAEGDWIEVGGIMGIVRSISVRATKIETFDKTSVIVPNADLVSGVVTNWTRGNSIGRVIVPVGVAYGTDTRKVEEILTDIANAHPMVVISPPPSVLFMAFGADSLDFEIRAIVRDVNFSLGVKSEMNHEIARRFNEEGIEIPFAQRDIWLRNPEALQPPQSQPGAAELYGAKTPQKDDPTEAEADSDAY